MFRVISREITSKSRGGDINFRRPLSGRVGFMLNLSCRFLRVRIVEAKVSLWSVIFQ